MPITLPDPVKISDVEPFLRDFGGTLTPFLGGEEIRLNRLGMRLGGRFSIPPTIYATDGQRLVSRLLQAKASRLVVPWPQPGFDPGTLGTPLVQTAVAGGTSLQIKGLPSGKSLVEGQFLTLHRTADGRRYLHALTANSVANGAGIATVALFPPMRVSFAINDAIDLEPSIEGHVLPGEELRWKISLAHHLAVEFSVVETK